MAIHSRFHVVIFPYMAQGHTLPLLDISKAIARRGLKVTIITTPSNAPFIRSKVSSYPTISLSIIPFPKTEELPEGCENTSTLPSLDLLVPFMRTIKKLKQPFEEILKEMSKGDSPPICVISDFFLGWTLDSCRSLGIPRIVSQGMGALPMAILKSFTAQATCIMGFSNSESIKLPNLHVPFPLMKADFPKEVRVADPSNAFFRTISELEEASTNSWGTIVNSFEELEVDYVATLESLYQNKARAWCVGPLLLHDQIKQDLNLMPDFHKQSRPYIKWLDRQVGTGVVIYVSFGSEAHLPDTQMDEIAFGLEMAGQPFIWVVRSKTWFPPIGWEKRVKEMGLVLRDWVDQRSILAHPSTGGFLSHCGWNSVLESLSMGVPLLTWPIGAEQPLNAKYVAMVLRAGIIVPQERDKEDKIKTIHRGVICDRVQQLLRGDKGKKARERAQELGKMARQAVIKGGSSDKKLDELIECLILQQRQSSTD